MNRVLIIEDEINTAMPVREGLELNNIKADIAKDGSEGIEMFKANDYDLVLLDLQMPKMNGEQVLAEIRKEDPYVDVIVYTNFSEFADIKKLANIGIQGYINKGADAELTELIGIIMNKLAPLTEDDVGRLFKSFPNEFFEKSKEV